METLVRVPRASDRSEWQRLWLEYLIFYESQLGPGHPDLLWGRILDPDHPIECLVAEGQGGDGLAGIAHLVPHYDTWESRRVCYLQDLFVDPARRGRGVATALIRAAQADAGRQEWAFVYWQTSQDNHRARLLYDRLTGGETGFVIYQLGTGSEEEIQG